MLTSGSLAGQKRLDRIQILVEPPPLRALRSLRVGFPSRRRANLLFSCEAMRLRHRSRLASIVSHAGESSYRCGEPLWPRPARRRCPTRSTRTSSTTRPTRRSRWNAGRWTSRCSGREPSRHIREHAGGMSWVLAQRSAGRRRGGRPGVSRIVVGRARHRSRQMGPAPRLGLLDSAIDTVGLSRLNGDLFTGDLGPPPWGWGHTSGVQTTPLPPGLHGLDVDRACPGRQALERCLNRNSSDRVGRDSSRIVRLFYANAPTNQPKPTAINARRLRGEANRPHPHAARAGGLDRHDDTDVRSQPCLPRRRGSKGRSLGYVVQVGLGAVPVFTIRCPIACNAALSRPTTRTEPRAGRPHGLRLAGGSP